MYELFRRYVSTFCQYFCSEKDPCRLSSVHQVGFEDPWEYQIFEQYHPQKAKEKCPLTKAVTEHHAYHLVQWIMRFR